ncbi:MAG: winged helix-turn-helix domain-containing protein [Tumebacillaceae bacterium]
MPIQFHEKDFSITHGPDKIVMLPKEYALLHFLYANKNQPFTREDLLDRVWPLEAPVDRTVDDHIYRLRKKTKHWDHLFTLDTIRGSGYRLTLKVQPIDPRPLAQDPEVTATIVNLMHKYHLFGQGEALRVLTEHRAALGVSLSQTDEVRLHFMNADFEWILEHLQMGQPEDAYLLLFMLLYIHEDAERTLYLFERACEKGTLPQYVRLDLMMGAITLNIDTGRTDHALHLFRELERIVVGEEITSFLIFMRLHEFYLNFFTGHLEKAERILAEVESLLVQYPYQREKGAFTIAKGVWALAHDQRAEADACFTEGLQILRQSQFVSHVISGLYTIRKGIRRIAPKWELRTKYQKLWDDLAARHRFAELEPKIAQVLDEFLR